MTSEEAIAWTVSHSGSAGRERLERFGRMIVAENDRQNLISRPSVPDIWPRHLVDSAQLLHHAPTVAGRWIDIGSGPGLPGLVVAILGGFDVTLIEPRRRRIEFMRDVAAQLSLRVDILACRAENYVGPPADIVSARAVGTPSALFAASCRVRQSTTTYILPRGRMRSDELELLRREWHGLFHVEQSLTNDESSILIAREVSRR